MPLNAKLALTQELGSWRNTLEGEFVAAKDDVSAVRNEMQTAGYGLAHLRSRYERATWSAELGIENLFDRFYDLPLGGAYVGQGSTMMIPHAAQSSRNGALPYPGRPFDLRECQHEVLSLAIADRSAMVVPWNPIGPIGRQAQGSSLPRRRHQNQPPDPDLLAKSANVCFVRARQSVQGRLTPLTDCFRRRPRIRANSNNAMCRSPWEVRAANHRHVFMAM